MVRRSFRHIAEARDAIDQTRAAVATSRLVIERSRKHLKARSVRIADQETNVGEDGIRTPGEFRAFETMPRYYFEVDGLLPDCGASGEDLQDDEHAWHEATQFAGQLFKDIDGKLRPGQEWRLVVSDADRNQLYAIHVKSEKSK